MSGVSIVTAMVEILVAAFTGIGTAMGTALNNFATAIFITETAISVFGSFIMAFAAIALALGLFRWVLNFLTSLGARNR